MSIKRALITAFILIATPAVQAQDLSDRLVSERELSLDEVHVLPAISKTSIVVNQAPRFAAVQPTVDLVFYYRSCAAQTFYPSFLDDENVLFVGMSKKFRYDCAGPVKNRKYRVQIASDLITKPIVVANPVTYAMQAAFPGPKPVPVPIDRFCTAVAGVLFDPVAERCVGFTNGCQRADMIAAGMEAPKVGQCKLR